MSFLAIDMIRTQRYYPHLKNSTKTVMTLMTNDSPLLETTIVNSEKPPVASVIWLHGLGADSQDFVPIVSELRIPSHLPIRFVFPNAPMQPVTINNGYVMRAWYDIVSLNINDHADQKGINTSVKELNRLIDHEEKQGIPSNRIIIGGFSQGAVIALTTGLSCKKHLAGILALSGYLPYAEEILQKAPSENKNVPIFLGHGTQDHVVPFFLGQMTYDALIKHHHQVDFKTYPVSHTVSIEEIFDIRKWLIDTVEKSLPH